MTLQPDRYETALETEGAAFAAVVRDADLEQRVPTCPEWTVAQLAGHVGGAHRWVAEIVRRRAPTSTCPSTRSTT
ncbi:MAG: maleylpyruvate isomerase N-terminal domain-containing protein [Pseudonocardiaceae bacterium]